MYKSDYEQMISNPVWKEIVTTLQEVMRGLQDDVMSLDPLENSSEMAQKQGRYKMAEFVLALPEDILREIEETIADTGEKGR
jgi:hypothetical protein